MSDLFNQIFDAGDERSISDELPGRRPPAVGAPPERQLLDWDARPIVKRLNNKDVEFFTIGQLAMALGVKAVTLRSWEQKGWVPHPPFRTRPPQWGGLPNKKQQGRRLWTRAQVAGIVRIAQEEGMVGLPSKSRRKVDETKFRDRVVALYEETKREIQET